MVPANLSVLSRALIQGTEPPASVSFSTGQASTQIILVSTQAKDTDLFANVHNSFDHFMQSGQAWTLVIGFFVGYFLRGLTH